MASEGRRAVYAVLGHAEIEPDRADEAEAMLRNALLPQVKEMDGFVSGTWTRSRDRRHGRSVVIFDDEASAEKAAENARAMAPPPGAPMAFGSFDVVEVLAQA
jgi:heme-degrading monooxygenase HmoA